MYTHETDADLATFVDRFWRHQITLAERDYDDGSAAASPDDAPPDDAGAFGDDDETTRLARLAPPLTDWKAHTLPLARIKKVQKLDPEVKVRGSDSHAGGAPPRRSCPTSSSSTHAHTAR